MFENVDALATNLCRNDDGLRMKAALWRSAVRQHLRVIGDRTTENGKPITNKLYENLL